MEKSLINTVIGLGVLALTVYVVGKAWKKSQEPKSSAIGNGTVKKPLKKCPCPDNPNHPAESARCCMYQQ
jgi:hypothetical protein